jgi:hypothetical protein
MIATALRRARERVAALGSPRSGLEESVFVLVVTADQSALAGSLAYHEIEAADRRIDRGEDVSRRAASARSTRGACRSSTN